MNIGLDQVVAVVAERVVAHHDKVDFRVLVLARVLHAVEQRHVRKLMIYACRVRLHVFMIRFRKPVQSRACRVVEDSAQTGDLAVIGALHRDKAAGGCRRASLRGKSNRVASVCRSAVDGLDSRARNRRSRCAGTVDIDHQSLNQMVYRVHLDGGVG